MRLIITVYHCILYNVSPSNGFQNYALLIKSFLNNTVKVSRKIITFVN